MSDNSARARLFLRFPDRPAFRRHRRAGWKDHCLISGKVVYKSDCRTIRPAPAFFCDFLTGRRSGGTAEPCGGSRLRARMCHTGLSRPEKPPDTATILYEKTAPPSSDGRRGPPIVQEKSRFKAYLRTVFRSLSSPPGSTGRTGNPAGGSGNPDNRHAPIRPPSGAEPPRF